MVFSALFSFHISKLIWNLSNTQWGDIVLSVSLVFFLIAFMGWWWEKPHELVALHGLVDTVFLTIGLFYLLDKHNLFLAYGLEATALHYLSHRTPRAGDQFCRQLAICGNRVVVFIALVRRGGRRPLLQLSGSGRSRGDSACSLLFNPP